jgi:hypothetical protein
MNLNQDLELLKSTMKKQKMNLIRFKMLGGSIAMGRIFHEWGWFGEFYKVHNLFKN